MVVQVGTICIHIYVPFVTEHFLLKCILQVECTVVGVVRVGTVRTVEGNVRGDPTFAGHLEANNLPRYSDLAMWFYVHIDVEFRISIPYHVCMYVCTCREYLDKHVIPLAKDNPHTTFYVRFRPGRHPRLIGEYCMWYSHVLLHALIHTHTCMHTHTPHTHTCTHAHHTSACTHHTHTHTRMHTTQMRGCNHVYGFFHF